MTEAELQAAVLEVAEYTGWLRAHFRPGRTNDGYRTPVEADGKGFPDLVLVRGTRLLFVELKSERGQLSPEQEAWFAALVEVAAELADVISDALGWAPEEQPGHGVGVEVYTWRPADWTSGRIEELLKP